MLQIHVGPLGANPGCTLGCEIPVKELEALETQHFHLSFHSLDLRNKWGVSRRLHPSKEKVIFPGCGL